MDAVFNRVLIPTTVILFIAVLVSISDISMSSFSFYWNVLLLLTTLSLFLIGYITGSRLIELLYMFIL